MGCISNLKDCSKLCRSTVVLGAGRDPVGPSCAAQCEGKAGGEPVLIAGLTLKESRSELARLRLSDVEDTASRRPCTTK
eukprot:1028329-Rhodomonas_salina.2